MVDTATWVSVGISDSKKSLQPFKIKGFIHLPKKIDFTLDLTYTNPNDKETYTKSIGIESFFEDTTINIENVSNPPDKYKGEKVPISVTIKNEGSYNAIGIVFWIKVQSIHATGLSLGYRNDDGNIIFTQIFSFVSDIIAPGAQKVYNIEYHYAHSNGAMNVGHWKVIEVAAQAYNSNVDVQSCNEIFNVNVKALGSGPHAVFIYCLWSGIGDTTFPENPQPYIEHTTTGEVRAGLYMFKKQYNQLGDDYIDFNMIICKEDSNWGLPISPTLEDSHISGRNRVGAVLNIINGKWKEGSKALYIDNCGFDLLLILASRRKGGFAFAKNCAVACWAGSSTAAISWRYNIDGLVQHEVSHCFGAIDYHDGHPLVKCIMVYRYRNIFNWDNYLYEKLIWVAWFGCTHDPTNNWCTNGSCSSKFAGRWNQFYIPKLS